MTAGHKERGVRAPTWGTGKAVGEEGAREILPLGEGDRRDHERSLHGLQLLQASAWEEPCVLFHDLRKEVLEVEVEM